MISIKFFKSYFLLISTLTVFLLPNTEYFKGEHTRLIRRHNSRSILAVGVLWGTNQFSYAPNFHTNNCFFPSFDDLTITYLKLHGGVLVA